MQQQKEKEHKAFQMSLNHQDHSFCNKFHGGPQNLKAVVKTLCSEHQMYT